MRVGIDIGGTFTDCAVLGDDGRLTTLKMPSTPRAPGEAVDAIFGALDVNPQALERFVHGTTIITNLLVERNGGRIALLTTAGFEDVLELQHGDKPNTYDVSWSKPEPFVARPLRLGVQERMAWDGSVLEALGDGEIQRVVELVRGLGCDAIAVSLFNAHANPDHEELLYEALTTALPEVHCCISTKVDPAIREYERTSTTVLNAYAMPMITEYIAGRSEAWGNVHYASSSGGAVLAEVAARLPISLAFSGPAGGVVGAGALSRRAEYGDVITFDMGGTSTDVAIVRDGQANLRQFTEVEWGIPYRFPSLDIKSVGAGGGSIVWVDDGGALRVGPRSAGSEPGPACYGKGGTRPAVTDLNLTLGLLPSPTIGDDSIQLSRDAAIAAITTVAEELGVGPMEAAYGAWRIVNAAMAQAIREISVYKGIDPRDFSLFCFGSAAGQHAAEVAKELRMPRVILPAAASVFSAVGMLATRVEVYGKQSVGLSLSGALENGRLEQLAEALELSLRASEASGQVIESIWALECRQQGQTHSLEVAYTPGRDNVASITDRFRVEHARLYGVHGTVDVEVLTLRLILAAERPTFDSWIPQQRAEGLRDTPGRQYVQMEDAEVPVHDRNLLGEDDRGLGPCLVTDQSSTAYVPHDAAWHIDAVGSLVINLSSPNQEA